MDMEFYHSAKKMLYRLWEIIKNTKDDVIAGVVCSIVALCRTGCDLKMNSICSHLGIQMSTIQRQVEQNVFNHLRVKGFTSLVRSSSLLKNVMIKLGLVEPGEEVLSVVQFTLGNATDIYNVHDDEVLPITPCLLVMKTTHGSFVLIDEEYRLILGEHVDSKHIMHDGVLGSKVLSFQFTEYENPKGPPESISLL